jgi:hypothetical protein
MIVQGSEASAPSAFSAHLEPSQVTSRTRVRARFVIVCAIVVGLLKTEYWNRSRKAPHSGNFLNLKKW